MQNLVEFGTVVLEKMIFKFCQCIFTISYLSPLARKKLHLNKLESSSPKDAFVPSLVEIGPVVFEKKIFKLRQCIFVIS